MKGRILVIAALAIAVPRAVSPQVQRDQNVTGVLAPRGQEDARNRLELSKSRPNYPVTPGDVYVLRYQYGGSEVSRELLVESDYTVDLGVFGNVHGEGLVFPELKNRVEGVISRAVPGSQPFLAISSIGVFEVYLSGEVPRTGFVTAWGLSRLSEVIRDNRGPYSSVRDVRVVSRNGETRAYDVFRALSEGAVDQDPFVRPGDTIVIARRAREVELKGEVYRPGRYQLLPPDGIDTVIRRYGGGLTSLSDAERITLERAGGGVLRTFSVSLGDPVTASFALEDGDVISIPPLTDRRPAVVFEGAVTAAAAPVSPTPAAATGEGAGAKAAEPYNRLVYRFAPGDTLSSALTAVAASISPSADLAHAYVVRGDSSAIVPVDLEAMFLRRSRADDVVLQPSDRIVIPYFRYFIMVVGAVSQPGSYPYVPQKTFAYYVSAAGGIPPAATQTNVSITDAAGKPKPLTAIIEPEDRIILTEERIPVAGGVYLPGSYAYVPGKKVPYYVDLAGGTNPEVNAGGRLKVFDSQGKRKEADRTIEPGDRIVVKSNNFLFGFNKYFPLITSAITLVTSAITLTAVLSK